MILSDALATFEAKFEENDISKDDKAQYKRELPICWSGGVRKFEETPWALYALKEAAIVDWLDTALSVIEGKRLKWIVKPELLEFQITIADRIGQHRAVNNRFAVKSQFVTED